MPPKRKSQHLKLLAGTSRPDRVADALPAFIVLDTVPTAPTWLLANAAATAEFSRLALILVRLKLLHVGNLPLLEHAAALHSSLVRSWQGDVPPSAALVSEYRRLLAALGLSSLAAPAPAKANRFLTKLITE